MKRCTKFQVIRANRSGTGALGTWQHDNLWFSFIFTSSSPLKFSWYSSFHIARSTCTFFWCHIFSFEYLWSKNINTERKTHVILQLLVNIRRRKYWKNNINVQKQPLEDFYKKTVLKGKNLSWSLFLIKLFQYNFPVNIAKFLRTSIFKNICERLLLNVVFTSNDEQHLLVKLDEMGLDTIVLCLFVSFWYYYICILSRSSRMEVFFKKSFLKILQNSQENTCAGVSF